MLIKKTNRTDMREMRDHRDNTAWELVKCYTLSQLSIMDWIDTRTIRNSWRYLPVRIDTAQSLSQFKLWNTRKPYMTMRIRMDEIKALFSKRNKGKKLVAE